MQETIQEPTFEKETWKKALPYILGVGLLGVGAETFNVTNLIEGNFIHETWPDSFLDKLVLDEAFIDLHDQNFDNSPDSPSLQSNSFLTEDVVREYSLSIDDDDFDNDGIPDSAELFTPEQYSQLLSYNLGKMFSELYGQDVSNMTRDELEEMDLSNLSLGDFLEGEFEGMSNDEIIDGIMSGQISQDELNQAALDKTIEIFAVDMNTIEQLFGDDFEPLDSDGDGTPDYKDTDSDDDGTPDSVEAQALEEITMLQGLTGLFQTDSSTNEYVPSAEAIENLEEMVTEIDSMASDSTIEDMLDVTFNGLIKALFDQNDDNKWDWADT
ncbi:hypothetical protein GF362_03320 [Candidatus Dojkabacteria bacterium]|nr:hypothetical protein [Candidatus Dojkabacteria bacterium]